MRFAGLILTLLLGAAACGVAEGESRIVRGERLAGAASASLPAPPLEGVALDGGAFRLVDLRGDVVVLVFHRGPYCGICQQRLRVLAAHRSDYDDLDARVVAVVHGPRDDWAELADELDLEVPVVVVDRPLLERWGVWPRGESAPRPAAFVVDELGRIRFRHVGATAADRVGDLVLLAVARRARGVAPPTLAR